jgi:hypothetical protein
MVYLGPLFPTVVFISYWPGPGTSYLPELFDRNSDPILFKLYINYFYFHPGELRVRLGEYVPGPGEVSLSVLSSLPSEFLIFNTGILYTFCVLSEGKGRRMSEFHYEKLLLINILIFYFNNLKILNLVCTRNLNKII